MIDETQMPIAPEHAFKEKSAKLLILQPSEPFTFGHFNVRHPVGASQYCSKDISLSDNHPCNMILAHFAFYQCTFALFANSMQEWHLSDKLTNNSFYLHCVACAPNIPQLESILIWSLIPFLKSLSLCSLQVPYFHI